MLPSEENDGPWRTGRITPTNTGRAAVIGPFGMAITRIISTTGTSTHLAVPELPSTSSKWTREGPTPALPSSARRSTTRAAGIPPSRTAITSTTWWTGPSTTFTGITATFTAPSDVAGQDVPALRRRASARERIALTGPSNVYDEVICSLLSAASEAFHASSA